MQATVISVAHPSSQNPENFPVRLNRFQKLGRLFRIVSGKTVNVGKGSPSVSKADLSTPTDEKRFLSPPTSPGFGPTALPKASHEITRPNQGKGHGNRTLHHSISTPTIGRLNKGNTAQRRISGEDDSGNAKPAVPVVISLPGDLHPSQSQSKKSQPLSTITGVALNTPGSQEADSSKTSSQLQKRSTDNFRPSSPPPPSPSPANLTVDRALELNRTGSRLKRRFSTSPKPSHQDSFESSSASPASSAFYPAYAQERHLRSMTSLNSGVTSATTLEEPEVQLPAEERTCLTRKKSVGNKVRRLLGSYTPSLDSAAPAPRSATLSEFGELSPPGSPSPSHNAFSPQSRPGSPENSSASVKASRRMSLTLSTLTSIPSRLRPPLHIRRPSANTLASLSPTSPVNRSFDSPGGKIPDYISEESNELRDNVYATGSTHSLVSPIAFVPNPPSPVCTRPAGRLNTSVETSPTTSTASPRRNLSFAWPTPSSPRGETNPDSPLANSTQDSAPRAPVDSRPRSLSHASPTTVSAPWSTRFFTSRGSSDARSNAPPPAPRPLSPGFDEDQQYPDLPVRAGWLESPVNLPFSNIIAKPEREPEQVTVTTKMAAADWSGRWNEDDMQQVISKLRKLR